MNQTIDKANKKKEVLKLLSIIGIDTRYVSYTPKVLYINDQRFAKFSKKRQATFKKYYPEIEIINSNVLRKICIKFSEIIANEISPKNNVLILKPKNKVDYLLKIVLEPYARKYGIKIMEYDIKNINSFLSKLDQKNQIFIKLDKIKNIDKLFFSDTEEYEANKNDKSNLIKIDSVLLSQTLDDKVESILTSIFKGEGIPFSKSDYNNETKIVYPFINVPNSWIDTFLETLEKELDSKIDIIIKNKTLNYSNNDSYYKITKSFMDFIEEIIPQYRGNILKSSNFIEDKLINTKKSK